MVSITRGKEALSPVPGGLVALQHCQEPAAVCGEQRLGAQVLGEAQQVLNLLVFPVDYLELVDGVGGAQEHGVGHLGVHGRLGFCARGRGKVCNLFEQVICRPG